MIVKLNLILIVIFVRRLIPAKKYSERVNSGEILRKIIRIGLPSALENIIYNVAMTLVIRFLNQMDTEGINVAARSYTAQITNLSFCVGSALAQANAIMTGWYMGAGKYEICDKQTKKSAAIGAVLAILTYNGPVPEIGMKIMEAAFDYLDAPVSGGEQGARDATLAEVGRLVREIVG